MSIEVLHDELLGEGGRLTGNEALTEVEDGGITFDSRLASDSIEVELVLGSTDNVESALVVLEGVLVGRIVDNLNLLLSLFLNGARVRYDSNGRLELGFPREMEAKVTVVLEGDLTNLAFVDEEFSIVKREGLGFLNLSRGADLNLGLTSEDLVVNLVSFSLNVKGEWSSLSLHVTD